MSSIEILTLTDSEEENDDDNDLVILSETVVPSTSNMATMELTPVEQRRLLEQLKVPKNAEVKIKVVGSRGCDKRSLLSGGMTAQCKVVMNGVVLRKESLQGNKIFRHRKSPPQASARQLKAPVLIKDSEILTISDEESEPDRVVRRKKRLHCNKTSWPRNSSQQAPILTEESEVVSISDDESETDLISPVRKVTLQKSGVQKPYLVTDHLLSHHRQRSALNGGLNVEETLGSKDHQAPCVINTNTESPEEQDNRLTVRSLSQPDNQESLAVQSDIQETFPIQFDIQEDISVQTDVQETFAVQSNFQEARRGQLREDQDYLPAQEISQIEFDNIKTVPIQSDIDVAASCTSEIQVANQNEEKSSTTVQSDEQAQDVIAVMREKQAQDVIAVMREIQAAITVESDDEPINILQGDPMSAENDDKAAQKLTTLVQIVDQDTIVTENDDEVATLAQSDGPASIAVQSKEQVAVTVLSGDKPVSNLQSGNQAAMPAECDFQDATTAQKAATTVRIVSQAATTDNSDEQTAISVQSKKEVMSHVMRDDQSANTLNLVAMTAGSEYQAVKTASKVTPTVSSVIQAIAKAQNDNHDDDLKLKEVPNMENFDETNPEEEDLENYLLSAIETLQLVDIDNPTPADNSSQATVSKPEDLPTSTIGSCSPTDHGDSTLPPSISSLEITAVRPGKLFLPICQLSQLFPAVKVKDLLSECPDLAEDTIWDGRGVSHISVVAAIRMLDRFGDVFGLREELDVKLELARLEKNTCMTEKQEDTVASEVWECKDEFLAMMGLCRKEQVEEIKNDINIRRERARTRTRLRSGTRRKQSPNVALVGGKRSKDRSATRRVEGVKKKGKGKRRN